MIVVHRVNFLFMLFSVVGAVNLGFAAPTSPIQSLSLRGDQNGYEVGPFLEMLEDESGEFTINDVTDDTLSHDFVKVDSKALALGLTESVFWFRFSVHSESGAAEDKEWFFNINRCDLHDCKLFIPQIPSDQIIDDKSWQVLDWSQSKSGGQHKSIICNQITFALPPFSKTPKILYFRIHHPEGSVYFNFSIVTKDAQEKSLKLKTLWLGVYYGTLLSMLLFNIHLYIALRENTRLFYIFYIISVSLYFIGINDIFYEYFTEKKLHFQLAVSAMGLSIFWGAGFARLFLVTNIYANFLNYMIIAIMLAAAGILAITPFASAMFLNQAYSLLGTVVPFVIIGAGITCWRRGFRPIFFFLLAWTFLLLGGLIYVLTFRGLLPYSPLNINSLQIGSCFEVVILSFALGQRIRALRRERDSIRGIFGKYVSDKVCDEILSGRIALDGETKDVTVLISDLRDYTPLVDSTPPKELVRITNTYLGAMAETIEQHEGVVLGYVGDSIEAVFGAPLSVDNHPEMAVKTALEMRKKLNQVNQKLISEGITKLRHGIGIHSGKVMAANIGSADRLSYSLAGITVNIASRIQDLNKKFSTDILVSAATMSQIGNEIEVENLGKTEIKGLKEPLEIFKVI